MISDSDACYRAMESRDSRFDGCFVTAVTSTHIYCRPSCPAVTPKRANVRFYRTAAAAQAAGFRACRRCRPDAVPGSSEWNGRADLVARAMRLIHDGAIDRGGVAAVADRLAVTGRHLHRLLVADVGAGPLALARAQRADTARLLIETTAMSFADVAFASGFASVRQFNATMHEVFAATPTELRGRRRATHNPASAAIALRLPYRAPCDVASTLDFLGARAVAGIEELRAGVYRRTLRLPNGSGIVELADAGTHVNCVLRLESVRDLGAAVARCRRLLDLDADPVAIDTHLGGDPLLAPLVTAHPGRRVPGAIDGTEMAVRAVVGQQVSVAGARTVVGRVVAAVGEPIAIEDATLSHIFPSADQLVANGLAFLPMPQARRNALLGLVTAVADGRVSLDAGADSTTTQARLLEMPGIGPWTVAYIAMRALGDPDAFLASDLGVRHALEGLGHAGDPRTVTALAERWRPWRAYALQHLWSSLSSTPTRRR